MKAIILKLNHWAFPWYYKRCGEHFQQWTIFKSIRLLIDNYKHSQYMVKSKEELIQSISEINNKLHKENLDLKMRLTASDDQIDWANNNFGTDFTKSSDN